MPERLALACVAQAADVANLPPHRGCGCEDLQDVLKPYDQVCPSNAAREDQTGL